MLCLFVWKLGISSHLFRFVWLSSKFWKRSSWNPELVQWARRKMGSVLISSAFKVIKRYYLNHSKELNFMRTMFPISVWAKNMRGTPKRIKFPPKSVMSPPLFRSHLHECSTDCRRTLCSRDVQSESCYHDYMCSKTSERRVGLPQSCSSQRATGCPLPPPYVSSYSCSCRSCTCQSRLSSHPCPGPAAGSRTLFSRPGSRPARCRVGSSQRCSRLLLWSWSGRRSASTATYLCSYWPGYRKYI